LSGAFDSAYQMEGKTGAPGVPVKKNWETKK